MKRISTILILAVLLLPGNLVLGQDTPGIPVIVQCGPILETGQTTKTGTVVGFDVPVGGIPKIGSFLSKIETTALLARLDMNSKVTLYATRFFTVDQFGIAGLGSSGAVFYAGYGMGYTHYIEQSGDDEGKLSYRAELGFKFPWLARHFEFYVGCDFVMPEVLAYEPFRYYPHVSISLM